MKDICQCKSHKILSWIMAVAVPVAYLVFYTPYGMDTTDFGYFYGYAWRILQGQVPYRDFYYIKPALPLFWHALWMAMTPENIQVLAGKAGFVVSMLATSWFAALFLNRFFHLELLRVSPALLATCGFVWGVHSFPHMPWHTPDGILFSSAALCSAAYGWVFLAGALAACAMLCKQSFLLVPLGVFFLVWVLAKKKTLVIRCICGWLFVVALAYGLLAYSGALEHFFAMTTGQLDIREAIDAGILIYVRQKWWLALGAAVPFILAKYAGKSLPDAFLPCALYLPVLGVWYVGEVLTSQSWIGYGASWPTLLVVLGGICVLFPKAFLANWVRRGEAQSNQLLHASTVLAVPLLVAWSVAISGGYKIPAFFAVPLIFSLILVHAWFGGNARRIGWTALMVGLVMFGFGYQYPYVFPVRSLSRDMLIHDAGKIYPKANGVLVDADMYARLEELKALRQKYGANYKTLPGFCLSYYLNGDYPAYPSDWLIDWEINADTDVLYQRLVDRRMTVFMERDQLETEKADGYDRAAYSIPQRVRREWCVIEETPHFVVFQPPS